MINIALNDELCTLLNDQNIDVKDYVPAYNGESAGLDLYNAGEEYFIPPSREELIKILIPTGLRVIIPRGYVGLIQERGSICKTSLKVRAGVIDAGYTGEIFVNCINVSNRDIKLDKHCKLPFQLVVVKCDNDFNVITENEYLELTENAARKSGKVGSSD